MKIISAILNILLLVAAVLMMMERGLPSIHDHYFFLSVMMVAAPSVTLLTAVFSTSASLVSLYFKQKTAEAKKRIAEIEKETRTLSQQ